MANPTLKKILMLVGTACFFVGIAWVSQATAFGGEDRAAAQVVWSLAAALMLGFGIGFFLISYLWFA